MRIMLADDHSMFRQGLRKLLEAKPDFRVIAEACDGREAVDMARQLTPDIILMDVSMPGLNGVEATRTIVTGRPGTRILGLSMHTDRRYPSELLRAGAAGYLPKDATFDELERAVRSVLEGKTYLSPRLSAVNSGDEMTDHSASAFER